MFKDVRNGRLGSPLEELAASLRVALHWESHDPPLCLSALRAHSYL